MPGDLFESRGRVELVRAPLRRPADVSSRVVATLPAHHLLEAENADSRHAGANFGGPAAQTLPGAL